MSDPFEDPGHADKIEWSEVNGSLLLFDVTGIERDVATVHGVSDAVKAKVTVLDGTDQGTTYEDILVFPKVLRSQLSGRVGKMVLGRLEQGAAEKGKNPPWTLADPTDKDKQVGRDWIAANVEEPF